MIAARLRSYIAVVGTLVFVGAAHAQTTTASGCGWNSVVGAANAACANWTVTRTFNGQFTLFNINLTNTSSEPFGRPVGMFFSSLFMYVPSSVTEANVSAFSGPTGWSLSGGPFNGTIHQQGVALGNNQSIIDWSTGGRPNALELMQTGVFSFQIAGDIPVGLFGAHAQNVGTQSESMWVVFPPFEVAPEPSTYALLGSGLVGLGVFARRRRTR